MRTVCSLFCVLGLMAWGGDDPGDFKFSRELSWAGTPAWALVQVDGHVAVHTRRDLGDLRLFNQDGLIVPYLLQQAAKRSQRRIREPLQSRLADIERVGEGRLQIGVEAKGKVPASGLEFATSSRGFKHAVDVDVLVQGQWQRLVTGATIYDRGKLSQHREVTVMLPAHAAVDYRIKVGPDQHQGVGPVRTVTQTAHDDGRSSVTEIRAVPDKVLQVSAIQLFSFVKRVEAKAIYDTWPVTPSGSEQTDRNETMVAFPRGPRELTSIGLTVGEQAWARTVILEGQAGEGMWQRLGSARFVAVSGAEQGDHMIHLGADRHEQYRLRIPNNDEAPLTVRTVLLRGPRYELAFIPTGPVSLSYGNPTKGHPQYAVGDVLDRLKDQLPGVAEFAKPVPNANYAPGNVTKKWLSDRAMLGIALVFMVLALGAALARGAKQVQ